LAGSGDAVFLNKFVNRKCAVIPVILPLAKGTPELPWPLENLHRVDFRTDSYPLQRLIWGITGKKPAELEEVLDAERPATMWEPDNTRLVPGRDEKSASVKNISEARLYPPLAEPPDPDNATQLNILRKRVSEYWVDGVLGNSLYNEVMISLGKRKIDKAIDAPWKYTVEVSDAMNSGPLDDRGVSVIYGATGLLLILGEPGSGKTTTLLDLARTLLERAGDDIKERVAVVLNLSNWKKKQTLAEWISIELSEKYRVPRKIGRLWLHRGYLLPLLDGLDEVGISMQPDCVATINTYIEQFHPSGLVVCCRLNEYRWLPKRLKLNGAICIEPLGSEEVSKYLDASGSKLAVLREAVDADPVLHELAQTPLVLSIMSLAYQGAGGNDLAGHTGDPAEKRRKQIFELYVEQMFRTKGTTSLVFPKDKIIGWLSWLAQEMREHSQSVFLVEKLQPSWLGATIRQVAQGIVVALSIGLIGGIVFGLIFGLIYGLIAGLKYGLIGGLKSGLIDGLGLSVGVGLGCWTKSPFINGLISGLICGLITGLIVGMDTGMMVALIAGPIAALGIGSLNHITLVEAMSWKWNQCWKMTIPGLIFGLVFGVFRAGSGSELLNVPISALIFGLITGLVGGLTGTIKVDKVSPNQGINLSGKNSFASFLVTFLTVGLIAGLFFGLHARGLHAELTMAMIVGLTYGLVCGLGGGLIAGLNRGGSAVIKHYALRLILWLSGNTPFKFIKFLDDCARLILLKKVGGGYIFVHRMLLDYFADLTPASAKAEKGKARAIGP
jgi:eukaryotic-like serine/threonine-protein kinase